jgi:isopenicillin N synthase-like dioxygenase
MLGSLARKITSGAGARRVCSTAVPLVDVAALQSSGSARAAAVKSLHTALVDRGFFYAANVSSLPASYIASIYDYSHRVHALPVDVKRRFAQRGGTGAYSGPDIGQPEVRRSLL